MNEFNVKQHVCTTILSFLDDVVKKSEGYDVYLGGGFLRDTYWNRSNPDAYYFGQDKTPKDIDIFFIPQDGAQNFVLPTISKTYINYDIDASEIENVRENVKHVRGLFANFLPTRDVQFIVYDKPMSIKSLAEDMDCNINGIMYNPLTDELFMTEDFIQGHKNKVIEMLHTFEEERMYKRLVRMKSKFTDYTLKHNISDDMWDWYALLEQHCKKKRSGGSTGSFIEE